MKRITTFLISIAVAISLCSHSSAQERARRVTQPAVNNNSKFALKLTRILVGHNRQVLALALSSNSKLLATVTEREDATRLWNTDTGELIATLDGTMPLFSPDGHVLVTTCNKNIKLWDAATGKLKLTLTGHERDITSVSFSPDGSSLAAGSADGTVRLWDAATGQTSAILTAWPVKKIPRHRIIARMLQNPPAVYVQFSPDGKFIVTQSTDVVNVNVVRLWERTTGRLIKEFKDLFRVIDFSPDSKWLGFTSFSQDVGVLNLETLMIQKTPGVDLYFLNQYAFSPDSRTYVMGSGHKNYQATLIDISTGQVTRQIPLAVKWGFDMISVFQKDVDILCFHPNGKGLMGANHKSVRIWDVATGDLVLETMAGRDPAAFSLDGKLLVTVGKDKKAVLLWEVLSN